MSKRNWCDTCRGDGNKYDELFRCNSCPRRFHKECAGLRKNPWKGWVCPHCVDEEGSNSDDEDDIFQKKRGKSNIKKRIAAVRKCHKVLKHHSQSFLSQEKSSLKPFVSSEWLNGSSMMTSASPAARSLKIGKSPSFINAVLRSYQVKGVNWILSRYALGTGCIVADEMGLGKTIQSLAFIAALKHKGKLPGPHLVVTPLAVLQNWANEIKRFTPSLTHVKIHGSVNERDRLLSRDDVVGGEFDIYLTTYDTFLSEEAFFTESFLFHTVIIDEGHRLKNASCKLCEGLARLNSPFRVLLTGTPLQNCLAELMALLQYILPSVPIHEDLLLANTGAHNQTHALDQLLISQARDLLEACMMRRIKSEVEASLLPKIEYVLKPPLTGLQRKWYRSFLESDGTASSLLTKNQLMSKVLQLGKVANHPKTMALTYDRERSKAAHMAKRAHGSQFIQLDMGDIPQTPESIANEQELRDLVEEKLVNSCGKLALLDRLMLAKQKQGSRVLVFTQFTLTLDILEEYLNYRFGRMGVAYLRLDGQTGRIQREMDMRSFNKPGCDIFCYIISTRAGGQGINLATADTVVLYDTCWNPQVDLQAQDRAHRIGQQKQVIVYRLISENTVEERVLARARQKMVLDALVIKKRGSEGGLADALVVEADDEEKMAKLSVEELWNMLSEGARKVFDPAVDKAEDFDAKDYDRLISDAKPAKWDDKTDSGSSGVEKSSVQGHDQSELDGTIFANIKQECDDESVSGSSVTVETTCSDSSLQNKNLPQQLVVDLTAEDTGSRRSKRARTPRTAFNVNHFDMTPKKKRIKMCHDSKCFRCRKKVIDDLQCIACPRVYHLECSGQSERPKSRSWYCPWHACITCNRKSSDAGGMLFHCVSCPLTYCFDCSPDEHTEGGQSTSTVALSMTATLKRRGVPSLKSYMFFTCGDCKT